jgi:predicted transposase/invertase (TIGR01784 family)
MYDNISKFLVERYSADFAAWLLGESIQLTTLSPTELSLEPIRADALILLQSDDVVLHCEFQTNPDSTMPFRMADYRLRVYRKFPTKRMVQVVIYLRQTDSELVYQTNFVLNNLESRFNVVRIWEVEPEVFLNTPGLLPYAALGRSDAPAEMLRQAVTRLEELSDVSQRNNLIAAASILSGLRLDRDVIRRVIRSEIMRESVIYQDILAEGEARGEARGIAEGEARMVMRLLSRRFGEIPAELRTQIQQLTVPQLEDLGEALLDFTSIVDVETWLS